MTIQPIGPVFVSQQIGYGPAPAGLEAMLESKTTKTGKLDGRTNAKSLLRDYERKLRQARRIDYRSNELPSEG